MVEASASRKMSERDSVNVDSSVKKPSRAACNNTEFFFNLMSSNSARTISTGMCNWPIYLFSAKLYTVKNQIFHSSGRNGEAFITPWQRT